MSGTATFVLPKDPVRERTGDMAMAGLLMRLARESRAVRYVALGAHARAGDDGVVVAKPRVDPARLLLRSATARRSLVHARFDVPELREAIAADPGDELVAIHSYMAEPILAAGGGRPLRTSVEVSEELVWRATHGLLGRLEGRRIAADELRIARASTTIASYDLDDVDALRAEGVDHAHWLDVTLEPSSAFAPASAPATLVFLGDRRWAPNHEAAVELARLWPAMALGVPGARLAVVGRPGPRIDWPEGVDELGFVDDLHGLLAGVRGIVAPIRTGGGVRVKILEAVSAGLPVVSTAIGIGSLGGILPLAALDDREALVDGARRLLLDAEHAGRQGAALHEANVARWTAGAPQRAVERWLA